MRILIIRSADDPDFNRYIGVPDHMSMFDAQSVVDGLIRHTKEEQGGCPNWDEDIEPKLLNLLFHELGWQYCDEEI